MDRPDVSPRPLRILSLSCMFPTPADPGNGPFVRRRLVHLAELAEVRAIARRLLREANVDLTLPPEDGVERRDVYNQFVIRLRDRDGGRYWSATWAPDWRRNS